MIGYLRKQLGYATIQSDHTFPNGVWRDFTLDEIRGYIGTDDGFVVGHALAFGWSEMTDLIPFASKSRIVERSGIFGPGAGSHSRLSGIQGNC